MTTPTGTISMSDVNIELAKSSTALIALNDGDVRNLAAKPSGTISMNDLRGKSAVNYGALTSNFTTRSEGQSFTFTLSGGTAVPNGTYYWRVEYISNTDAADFSATTGSFTVTSNTGSFTVTTVNDSLNEGNGTFRVVVGDASGVPVVFVTGPTVTVTETTTYSASASNVTLFRFGASAGRSTTLTVNTTQVANGTVLYWGVINTSGTVTTSDISAISGSVTISSNAATVTVTAAEVTNGSSVAGKGFRFGVYTDSGRTNLVAQSGTVSILASPTYAVSFSPTSINEGSASTLTVTTTNLPPSTTLYYTLTGTGTAADILGLAASGSMTTSGSTSSSVTSTWWAALDTLLTEGTETITFNLRTVSTSGTVVESGTLSVVQAQPTIGTITATRTGGATSGSSIQIFFSASGIPAYGAARTFSIQYSVNGGAYTATGLETTSVTLAANGTSIPSTRIYNAPSGGALWVTSLRIRLIGTGQTATDSAAISGFYI